MNTIWLARLQDSAGGAFDGNREISRQGLPQITPGGETVVETLENLLYPKLAPGLSLSILGGESVKQYNDPDLEVDLSFTAIYQGIDIDSIRIDQSENLENGTHKTQSGNYEGHLIANLNKTFIAHAIDVEGNQSEATALVEFKRAIWYGALSISPEDLVLQFATSMDQLGFQKAITNTRSLNRDYNCTGGKYIYIAYPSEWGDPAEVKTGVFDFSDFDVLEIQATDQFGVRMSYKLMHTGYQTGDDININVVRIETSPL